MFLYFMFFMCSDKTKFLRPDVGGARRGGSYPMDRQAGAQFFRTGDDHITEIEENME